MLVIENCHLNDQCSQRWDALEPLLDNPRVRFCNQCQSAVHWAVDELAQIELARQGKCYAVPRECGDENIDVQRVCDSTE